MEQVLYKFQITNYLSVIIIQNICGTIVLIFSVLPQNKTKMNGSFSYI